MRENTDPSFVITAVLQPGCGVTTSRRNLQDLYPLHVIMLRVKVFSFTRGATRAFGGKRNEPAQDTFLTVQTNKTSSSVCNILASAIKVIFVEKNASCQPPTKSRPMTVQTIRDFLKLESSSGLLLIGAMLLALVCANTSLSFLYDGLLQTRLEIHIGALKLAKPLLLWINDGLMAIFFLLVGIEVKREILEGELSSLPQVAMPGIAAGLFIGKQIGIVSFAWVAFKLGMAVLCGIGFTMSLFIATLALGNAEPTTGNAARLGVLLGSLTSSLTSSLCEYYLLRRAVNKPTTIGSVTE